MEYLTPQERSLCVFCGATLAAGLCLGLLFNCFSGLESRVSFSGRSPIVRRVDVNTADEQQLVTVPGIGPATARLIVEERQSGGMFEDVEDLTRVKGIGPARLRELRGRVCAGCGDGI